MCWLSHKCVKHIADKNMVVFKIIGHVGITSCFSLIKNFKYEYEQLYTLEKELVVENIGTMYIIRKGFHSYIEKNSFTDVHQWCVKCTIPKGSVYYYDESAGEIVSNQIIVHKPEL